MEWNGWRDRLWARASRVVLPTDRQTDRQTEGRTLGSACRVGPPEPQALARARRPAVSIDRAFLRCASKQPQKTEARCGGAHTPAVHPARRDDGSARPRASQAWRRARRRRRHRHSYERVCHELDAEERDFKKALEGRDDAAGAPLDDDTAAFSDDETAQLEMIEKYRASLLAAPSSSSSAAPTGDDRDDDDDDDDDDAEML